MERKPITKQRSSWVLVADNHVIAHVPTTEYQRNVSDGLLIALVSEEPEGWHLSISFRDHRKRLTRYPRWDEIADAREVMLPHDREFMMVLPRLDEYVAAHETTFHIHEIRP